MNRKGKFMLSLNWRSCMGAAAMCLAASMPVQAGVVTFEDAGPDLTAGGFSLSSGGYNFTDDNVGGFVGIDSAEAFFFAAAPANPTGQFLFMLNAAGVRMTSESGLGFFLNTFDVAFISPIPGLAGGPSPGRLAVALYDLSGVNFANEFFELPTGAADGDFPFATLSLSNRDVLSQAYFRSCFYQTDGTTCTFDGQSLLAQFALDNISDAFAVPEPGSALLALTAFGLMVMILRRRPIARA